MVTETRQAELDQIVNEHFMFEATDNLDGVMSSLADTVQHEIIPSPNGEQTDKDNIRAYYAELFKNLRGERVEPVRRYYGDNFVVDETLWHGQVEDGAILQLPGKSGPASFRLLHVFEVEEGKITREQAWIDLGALIQQLK